MLAEPISMPSQQLVLRQRAADRHVESRLPVAAVRPVVVAVRAGEPELRSLLAQRQRHLVEHQQGGDDLRDARDLDRIGATSSPRPRRGRRPPRCPAPARPERSPAPRRAVDGQGGHGRRDRVQRPQQGRRGVQGDEGDDQPRRHQHARAPGRPPRRPRQQIGRDRHERRGGRDDRSGHRRHALLVDPRQGDRTGGLRSSLATTAGASSMLTRAEYPARSGDILIGTTTGVRRAGLRGSDQRFDRRT